MKTYIKTLNVYNEEESAYIFDDRMYIDDFNEWKAGLLDACICTNIAHPELMHVMFIDEASKTMVQKYTYNRQSGELYRLLR